MTIPQCYEKLIEEHICLGGDLPSGISDDKPRESPNRSRGKAEGNPEPFLPLPLPLPPPPPMGEAVEDLKTKLRKTGVGKFAETIDESLSNGLGLDQITAVIDYWSSRPHAWGPGALRTRLTSPSAPDLPPDAGWPAPSPKETAVRRQKLAEEEKRRQNEVQQRQTVARERDSKRLEQLEIQFGPVINRMTPDEIRELLQGDPFLAIILKRQGPESPMVRPRLLKQVAIREGRTDLVLE